MTKPALAALGAALALALAATPAAAHGAPEPREIDQRLLLDNDGAGYGGEGACPPDPVPTGCAGGPGGVDLLALDVREAHLPDGRPAAVFRIVHQYEALAEGRTLTLSLTAGGQAREWVLTSTDGVAYAGADFDLVQGPFDVGDGHPKAIDAWISYGRLGAAPGDALEGIRLASAAGGGSGDRMPGTWTLSGQAVPATPNDEGELPGEAPASWTLAGPAALLTASLDATVLSMHAARQATLTVGNPLKATPQFVNLTLEASGANATLETSALNLEPGASRTVQVRLTHAEPDGSLTLALSSDLGARQRLALQVHGEPAMHPNATAPGIVDATHGDGHDHESKKSPLPPALAAMALALAAAWTARRRSP